MYNKAQLTTVTIATTGEYGDMLEMGILDPTKVTRSRITVCSISRRIDDHNRMYDH